ncbi:MAG: RecX family transcriptional regulator [Bacilli bacterium]|nr:RecX family transcriptional regulator [Bacilli bacterium]
MKINKFKKVGKSKYKIIFDNSEILLYEDVILKYDLLIKQEVDLELIDKIIEENKYYDAYHSAISYIEIKMRNKKEIISYLEKKDFDDSLINSVVSKLEDLGLLNNKAYIEAYVNDKVNLSNDGPYKIKNSLVELDFDEEDVVKYLDTIDEEVWKVKLQGIINKKKSLMKNKSYYMFISKIKNDCYNLGYDKYMIEDILSNVEYESNAFSKDFEKCFKKFKGDKNKIINSLLRKGYSYEEINGQIKNELD